MTSTPTVDHAAEKSRSYAVRRAILGTEGRDGTGRAVTLRAISNYAVDHPKHVTIPAGTVCRVTTSNAGFRGIECSATAVDLDGEPRVIGVSLGAFDPVAL